MGGFTSVTEGLPSGNSTTASGVPFGNAASENSGLTFSPSASPASFTMPETGSGSGNWTSQAFAPSSAMTQQMPEPNDIRLQRALPDNGTAWKTNQATLERASRNLLAENAFAPATQTREDKLNPIVSKLAREHPDNPVPLRGSLLGEPLQQQQPIKPPNPFAQRDELPKLPKVDWTAQQKQSQTPVGFTSEDGLFGSRQSMLSYPQRETPLPGGQTAKPDTGSQVAAAPAILAAPYVIEGTAAATTAAAAYWAAHPELHPKEPNWFSKMLGKNETSIADPEAAKAKIESFPAEAGKPSPLGGYPSEPPRLSGKETFPAQEPRKGDNVIHEQRPSKVDLPNAVDYKKIAPIDLSKKSPDEKVDKAMTGIKDQAAEKAVRLHVLGSGTMTNADHTGTSIDAPRVPQGREWETAKKAWESAVRQAGGDPRGIQSSETDKTVLTWKASDGTRLIVRDTSGDKVPTLEVQIPKQDGNIYEMKRRFRSF